MSDIYTDFSYAKRASRSLSNYKEIGAFALRFSCPYCGDSSKDKTKARGNVYKSSKNIIKYKCFNCGIGPMSMTAFLKDNNSPLYKEYLLDIYPKKAKVKKKKEINFKVRNLIKIDTKISLSKAIDNQKCLKYLTNRKIPNEHLDRFYYSDNFCKYINEEYEYGIERVPKKDERLILKCEKDGNLLGFVARSLDSSSSLRYINAKLSKESENLLFNCDNIDKNKDIYVLEGALDSLFVDNSISINQAGLSIAEKYFPKEKLVLVWDNEPRNEQISNMIKRAIDNGFRVVIFPSSVKEKDVNEMVLSNKYNNIKSLLSDNTYSGLEAKLVYNYWVK